MRRTFMCMITASALALGSLSVACGDDDVAVGPKPDSGTPDTGPQPPPPPDGGGDGGCTFASYVINLVNTQTNATAQPDPSLGQSCSDTTDQAAFAPLFP